ncbi:MAG: hypothetical protein OEY20_01785 [Gemmatimonadota bacterium]|nr:hypothetical protein [Gemmatimonadota bacterium]MDH5195963.1 hypothetical protein [Gemmatimonadota bacterium]
MLVLLVVAGVPVTAQAQLPATGSISVLGDVTADGLTISSATPLNFGILIPGTPTTLNARTSANAGKFDIRGARRAEFTLTLTLPTELRVGIGPLNLPVTFDGTSGCQAPRDNQNSCSTYDPSTVLTARIRNQVAPDNTFFVWLGGTVSPAVGQSPGVYTAVISALVQYTGN